MASDTLQRVSSVAATERKGGHPSQLEGRRALYMFEGQRPAERVIEEILASAVLASDVEFRRILIEFEKIAKALRSEDSDTPAVEIAHHPAVWSAIKQALMDRELRQLALSDELTSLYNRRGFFAAAAQLLKLARRKKQALLLFYCDLDNLKLINDSWGHHEGDLALVRAADALEKTFRGSDVVARIGGDEFAVLCPETTIQTQEMILQRLKKKLKKCSEGERRYPLSLSLGAARFDPKRHLSLGELMIEADQAMYEQKRRQSNSFPGN